MRTPRALRIAGLRLLLVAAVASGLSLQIPALGAPAGAATAPQVVGKAQTFGANNGSNTTAVPTGTVAGDVLVATVESYPFTTITCPKGWTQAVNATASSTVRVAVCVGVVSSPVPASVAFSVVPPTQV